MNRIFRNQMQDCIAKWMRLLENYPGWREWNRGKIFYTLNFDLENLDDQGQSEFTFSQEVEQQRQFIMKYLELRVTIDALRECEYYFRRYPFRELPVTYSGHITNICEMYFSRCYEFKQKLHEYLNALQPLSEEQIPVGDILKAFDKEFKEELRNRNQIHHHRRFSEMGIDRIFLREQFYGQRRSIGVLGEAEARREYRRATRNWVSHVRTTADKMDVFLEYVARVTLNSRTFLTV